MTTNRFVSYILCMFFAFGLQAQDISQQKELADSAYAQENYQKAAELYAQIAVQTVSADVCYNLGCSYYRLDSMAKSVLWFERASKLDPGDGDIRFNLDMARSKIIDKIPVQHDMIIVSAFRSLVNIMSVQGWTNLSMLLYALFSICIAIYLLSNKLIVKKSGFYSSVAILLLVILSNICAFQQREYLQDRNRAIVMAPAVTVKSTPSGSGNDLFVIHEGTRVKIKDNSLNEWAEVEIDDGKVGWIQKKTYEII